MEKTSRKTIIILLIIIATCTNIPTYKTATQKTNWLETIEGNDYGKGCGIAIDDNNDIYITGYTYGYGAGDADVFVAKLTNDGELEWFKTIGGNDYDGGYGIAIDDNNDIYVTGGTLSYGAGDADVFVGKFNIDYLDSNDRVYLTWSDDLWRRPILLSRVWVSFADYSPFAAFFVPEINLYPIEANKVVPNIYYYSPKTLFAEANSWGWLSYYREEIIAIGIGLSLVLTIFIIFRIHHKRKK